MLTPDQQDQLLLSLFATAEAMGLQLTQPAALVMVDDLKEFAERDLAGALKACRRAGGRLTVDAILKNLHAADGHPEPNEAWAIALQSFDEAETVLMTEEIQKAVSAAAPVMAARDKVGARMAFIAAYQRLVDASRATGAPVKWRVSLGHDADRRVLAIEGAERLGRLPAPEAARLLADHRTAPISSDGQAIAGLLTGKVAQPSADMRARWQELREVVQKGKRRKIVQDRWDRRKEMRDLRERKAVAESQLRKANQGGAA